MVRRDPVSALIVELSRSLNAVVDSSTVFLRGPPVLAYFTPLPATHLIAANPCQPKHSPINAKHCTGNRCLRPTARAPLSFVTADSLSATAIVESNHLLSSSLMPDPPVGCSASCRICCALSVPAPRCNGHANNFSCYTVSLSGEDKLSVLCKQRTKRCQLPRYRGRARVSRKIRLGAPERTRTPLHQRSPAARQALTVRVWQLRGPSHIHADSTPCFSP